MSLQSLPRRNVALDRAELQCQRSDDFEAHAMTNRKIPANDVGKYASEWCPGGDRNM